MITPKPLTYLNDRLWWHWNFGNVFNADRQMRDGQAYTMPDSPMVKPAASIYAVDPMEIINAFADAGITCKPVHIGTGQCFEVFETVDIFAGYARKKMVEKPMEFFPFINDTKWASEIQYTVFRDILVMTVSAPTVRCDISEMYVIFLPTKPEETEGGEIRLDLRITKDPVLQFDLREKTAVFTLKLTDRQKQLNFRSTYTGGCDSVELKIPVMMYLDVAIPCISKFRNLPVANQVDYLFRIGMAYMLVDKESDPQKDAAWGTMKHYWTVTNGAAHTFAPKDYETRFIELNDDPERYRDQVLKMLATWESDDLPLLEMAMGCSYNTQNKLDWIFTFLIQAVCFGVGGIFGKYSPEGWEPCIPCNRLKTLFRNWMLLTRQHTEILGTPYTLICLGQFFPYGSIAMLAEDPNVLIIKERQGKNLTGHLKVQMSKKDFKVWLSANRGNFDVPEQHVSKNSDTKEALVHYFTGQGNMYEITDYCSQRANQLMTQAVIRTIEILSKIGGEK